MGTVTVKEVVVAAVTVAVAVPNLTVLFDAVAEKFIPLIMIEFPPAVEPVEEESEETVGLDAPALQDSVMLADELCRDGSSF